MLKPLSLIPGKFFLFLVLILVSFASAGQTIPVTFKILNHKKESVAFANIFVINRIDTTKSSKKITDSTGTAKFELLKGNQYTIKISSISYHPIEKGIVITGNQTIFSYSVEPLGKTLETVVLRSKKPLMKQEDDKLIVDPENLVEASTSGYEVI